MSGGKPLRLADSTAGATFCDLFACPAAVQHMSPLRNVKIWSREGP